MAEKPPILFLHGAFGGVEVWRFLAPWFAQRGHRIATPRLPGPAAGPPLRLRDYVRRAAEAADTLEAPPVAIGYSLGGLVAQHLAARRPLAGMVLLASPGPWGLGSSLLHLGTGAPEVLAALMVTQAGGGALVGPELVRRALFTPETPAAWITTMALMPERESPLALLDALTWDLPPWFLARRRPVLALLGDADAFVPPSDLWSLALAWGAETESLRGFAHGLPLDPRWKSVAWRINAWLDERCVGSATSGRRLSATS